MSIAFKKMTRSLAWLMTASLAVAFMLPSSAAAIEFFPTPFRYQWKSQSGTVEGTATVVRANAGDTVAMSLTITNRSIDSRARVIYGKSTLLPEVSPYQGAHELRLGTSNPHDKVYDWVDPSSFITNPDGAANRLAVYDGAAVNPGGDLTFNFNLKIKAGTANGTYDFYAGVVREFDAWARQVNSAGRLLAGEDIFWRVIVGGGSVTPATGGLSIALASGTPAAISIAKGGNANFTKITLTAAAGATVKITSLYITRDGLTADSDVENVKLLTTDGVQVGGTAGGFNANHEAQIFITPALEITGSLDYYIRAGYISTATTGLTARLGIADATDIVSNATSVTGAPVYGNYMSAVAVTIGTVSVTEGGSVVDTTPDVGDTDVITNNFKITAGSTEGLLIDRITVMKGGSAETSDTINIELWDITNNKTLGTVASWSADGKASWPVNITLGKGDMISLRIQLDVIDGVGLTVNSDIADGSDYLVFAKGISYGFYITPTASSSANWTVVASPGSNNLGQGDYNQTINSGALTISKSGSTPATGNVAIADNQLLTVYDFDVKGESLRVSAVTLYSNINDAGAALYTDMTNARLVDMATGNILSGPVDGTDELGAAGLTTGVDAKFAFTNTFVLPVGVTKIGFKVRLSTDFVNADTVNNLLYSTAGVTAKGIITNNTISNTGTATGNTQTIKAGALVIETLGIPPTGNVVINTQDMIMGTYSFNAVASGENVLVSSFTVTDTMDATYGESDDFTNWELWADLTSATSSRGDAFETKISTTENPTSDATDATDTQAFVLTQTLEIPKGESRRVVLIADVAAGATADGTHQITSTTTACATTTGKDTGSDIAETGTGTAGTLTIAAAGSITTAVAASNPDAAIIIASLTNYTTVGAFRLIATDEAITVTKLTFDAGVDSGGGYTSMDKLKISYPTKSAGTATREVSVNAQAVVFDNIDMYVPKNGSAVVTASVTTKRIGTGGGGTFDETIQVGIDMDAAGEFAGIGESSGTALTGSTAGTTDRDGQIHLLYNSVPTIISANPASSGTIQNGVSIDLFKFKVTADAAGEIAIKKFNFTVFVFDASTTTALTADLTTFTFLRDGSDITASSQITDITTATPVTLEATNYIENNISTTVQVAFAGTPASEGEQLISAGQTVTYTLRATCGTFATGDSISTTLASDAAAQDAAHNYLGDSDTGAAVEDVIGLQTTGAHTATPYNFIWSDRSTLAHTSVFSETLSTATSTADWTNGYLIKNMPLSGYGYTL